MAGEIRQGVERLRLRHARRAVALDEWLDELIGSFDDRVLPIDQRVAQIWGRLNAGQTLAVIDSLLAATAEAYGLILVTRNIKDIARTGIRCLNPFERTIR